MWRRTPESSSGIVREGARVPAWAGRGTVLVLAAVVAALAGAGPMPARADCRVPSFTYKHAVVTFTEAGRTARVRVEIADTPAAMDVGLMCRTTLDPDAGMLFVFADTTEGPFWMKNTLIPLSIAFIDATWHIVALMDMKVASDPENGPFDTYGPSRPYQYALEVNLGFFKENGLDERAVAHFLPQETAAPPGVRVDLKDSLAAH